MATRLTAFRGTPESVAMLQPWVSVALLDRFGTPIGIDIRTGKVVVFDPWKLKELGIIHSPYFVVLGDKGFGKSTLMKSLTLRLMALQAYDDEDVLVQMRTRIHDRKPEDGEPEYAPLTRALESEVFSLSRDASINIFDPAMNMGELDLVKTAIEVCELVKPEGPLTEYQILALQIGIYQMIQDPPALWRPETLLMAVRGLDLTDVDRYYQAKDSEVLNALQDEDLDEEERQAFERLRLIARKPYNIPESQFREDAGKVSTYFGRLLKGDYGNMFGGNRSLRDVLSATMVTFDWTGVPDRARTLLEALLWKWQTHALENNDVGLIPHLSIGDEEHEAFTNLMHVRAKSAFIKKLRAFHTAEFNSTQHLPDYTAAGGDGSEIRELAKGIVRGVGAYFITRQPADDDVLHGFSRLGMSDQDVHYLTQLRVGHFAIKTPDHPPVFYRHVLTEIDHQIVASDSANRRMVNRRPWMEDQEALARAQELGIIDITGEVVP